MGVIDWIKDRHEERKRAKAYRKAIYMGNEAISRRSASMLFQRPLTTPSEMPVSSHEGSIAALPW